MIEILLVNLPLSSHHRMTHASKHVDPDAKAYLQAKGDIRAALAEAMEGLQCTAFGRRPLAVRIELVVPWGTLHRCDLDNLLKCALDAGNGVLYADDRWIDRLTIERKAGDYWLITYRVEEVRE